MYNPKEIEKKWQKFWEENNTFKTFNPSEEGFDKTKEKFYVLDMFPYPSWDWLHVWHPEWYTANDILARYKKTKWFNVLHPMWWDAFWLPAENYAIKTWTHPKITTAKNIENFKRQIKSLWFSYDWDREIDTTDPEYYKWTQWIFLKMFEAWLAYEQDLPINYCPSCKTWLANEEVLNDFTCERCWTKVEKRQLRQWVLAITKYADRLLSDVDKLDWPESIKEMQRNWIGKSEGTEFRMEKWEQKKWRLPLPKWGGLNCPAKSSLKYSIFENINFVKKKINFSWKIIWTFEIEDKIVHFNSENILKHFKSKSYSEFVKRVKLLTVVFENVENLIFIEKLKWYFIFKNKVIKVVFWEQSNWNFFVKTYYVDDKKTKFLQETFSKNIFWMHMIYDWNHSKEEYNNIIEKFKNDKTCVQITKWKYCCSFIFKFENEKELIEYQRKNNLKISTSLKQNNFSNLFYFKIQNDFELIKSIDDGIIENPSISVYTTRIDTVFGMTYAVLAPDHPKVWDFITPEQIEVCQNYIEESAKKSDQDRTADNKEKTWVFTGSYVINPFNNSPVPLWIWDYVLGNYGTWAVMAVPAHDQRDFEFAKKYNLEIIPTIYSKEIIQKYKEQADEIFFSNLTQEEADKHILETQKLEDNFFDNLPFTNDGFIWNINYSIEKEEDMEKASQIWQKYFTISSEEARKEFTKFAEENWFGKKKINYKLRDWLFSRQRYWWEPIPLIHFSKEEIKKLPRLSEEELNILYQKIENLMNKKMKVATLKIEGVVHNDNTAKPSLGGIIIDNIKKVKKKSKKISLKTYFEEKNVDNKTIVINWRYLLEHFKNKSRKEINLRKRNFSSIIENIEKIFFVDEKNWFLEINGKIWLIITEKLENKKYNILTYYSFEKLNNLLENKAYVLKTEKTENSDSRTLCSKWQEKSLVINWKIVSKIYSGIYSDIICDYNLPLELPEISSYEPAWDWNSPLARVPEFVNVKLASNLEWKRETNTMPQWWWSCWYYLRFMDNKNTENLAWKEAEFYWDWVDSYVWWAEHAVLHLLYARFWHKFLFDIWVVKTDEPFHKLRNQGLILAHAYERQNWGLVAVDLVEEKDWKYFEISTWEEVKKIVSKMSKSLKNVVNPDDIVNEYGADSLRLYEMYMADFKDSAPWDTKWIIWVVRFLEKAERLFTFEAKISTESDEETMKLLHKTIKKVEEDIENYKFNTAIAALMILVNNWLPKDENLQKEWKNIFARLLHPFAPHLAEELWERIWEKKSVFFSSWPKYDEKMTVDNEVTIWVQVMWKVRWQIKIWVSEDKDSVLAKAKSNEDVKKWIDWKEIVKEIYVPGKILNIVVK